MVLDFYWVMNALKCFRVSNSSKSMSLGERNSSLFLVFSSTTSKPMVCHTVNAISPHCNHATHLSDIQLTRMLDKIHEFSIGKPKPVRSHADRFHAGHNGSVWTCRVTFWLRENDQLKTIWLNSIFMFETRNELDKRVQIAYNIMDGRTDGQHDLCGVACTPCTHTHKYQVKRFSIWRYLFRSILFFFVVLKKTEIHVRQIVISIWLFLARKL